MRDKDAEIRAASYDAAQIVAPTARSSSTSADVRSPPAPRCWASRLRRREGAGIEAIVAILWRRCWCCRPRIAHELGESGGAAAVRQTEPRRGEFYATIPVIRHGTIRVNGAHHRPTPPAEKTLSQPTSMPVTVDIKYCSRNNCGDTERRRAHRGGEFTTRPCRFCRPDGAAGG